MDFLERTFVPIIIGFACFCLFIGIKFFVKSKHQRPDDSEVDAIKDEERSIDAQE